MDKRAKTTSPLTNEELAKKFKSNFELVNYAIKLAENMIKTGRGAPVESEFQSRALLVLAEITAGKGNLDENIELTGKSSEKDFVFDEDLKPRLVYDEGREDGRYRTAEARED